MPLYDYKCAKCDNIEVDFFVKRSSDPGPDCVHCGEPMKRLAASTIHTKIGASVDSKDVGKRIKQKNEQLKKKWSGYQRDDQNLRREITKMTDEKMKESK